MAAAQPALPSSATVAVQPGGGGNVRFPYLPFQKQIWTELQADDGLVVLARGLGTIRGGISVEPEHR
jgi:hypothetical protein